jgi:hypothetical protein
MGSDKRDVAELPKQPNAYTGLGIVDVRYPRFFEVGSKNG